MKYKVGDKVTVREDLRDDVEYDGIEASAGMVGLAGRVFTISTVDKDCYTLKEDSIKYCWTDAMFAEPAKETPTTPSEIHMTYDEWMIIQNLIWGECRDLEASLKIYPDKDEYPRTHEYVANTTRKLKIIGDKIDCYIDRENDHPLWWKRKDPNFYWLEGGEKND
jgi:hypothetical protein